MDTAVAIQSLVRGYGALKVIDRLDMRVPTGSIYGLLGPSGCGKTTLLRVMLGRLAPWAGSVDVLGANPGARGAPVPGSAVGYAPQELALYNDLSIHETLLFHARLHGLGDETFAERLAWLIEFLDLPEAGSVVGRLSGGQKRRVSLAVALLHQPRLLLLDEPTVGVDPELRTRIWSHLTEVADGGSTVIITTHYIEEARRAHRVGLMRHGVLLAEDDPQTLMAERGDATLEETFLALCRREVAA